MKIASSEQTSKTTKSSSMVEKKALSDVTNALPKSTTPQLPKEPAKPLTLPPPPSVVSPSQPYVPSTLDTYKLVISRYISRPFLRVLPC